MHKDTRVLRRWFEHEISTVHKGLVTRRKSLKSLLKMDDPHCLTREGQRHVFDKEVLNDLAEATPREKHSTLMLPITLSFDLKVRNECYISDEIAAQTLRGVEGYDRVYPFRNGKMWLPHSIGMELIRKYKGAIQQLFLP